MKRLIWFGLLGLLFAAGCKTSENPHREHLIVCYNEAHTFATYEGTTQDNVYAFNIKGHVVLCCKDLHGKLVIIPLAKNDCVVY